MLNKLIILLLISILTSCGGSYTKDEMAREGSKTRCEKIFSCDEGVNDRVKLQNETLCSEILYSKTKNDLGKCTDWDEEKAYECSSCWDSMTCEETFADKEGTICPVCEELWNICDGKK